MAKTENNGSAGLEQLKNDIKQKTPGPFYIFHGPEDYLRRYYFAQLRKLLLDELTEDFNYHHFHRENFTVEALVNGIETLPMMAERSLICLDDIDLFSLPESDSLIALLQDLPPHCCLVCVYEEFKPDKRKKKLWEAIDRAATVVEFAYQKESDLRAWIGRHFKARGKDISTPLCNYLLEQCGQSMTQLHGEIEKICAYSGAPSIVREDIDAVVEPTLEAVVFQITDALGQQDYDTALKKLRTLLKMQTEPIPIVAAIGAQMRRMYSAKIFQGTGKGAEALASLCGISSYAAGKITTQSRRFTEAFCRKAVLLCCETDYKIKTSYDTGERLVEGLILRLAQEARND